MSSRLCGGGPCDFSVTALGLGLSLGGLDLGLDNYFNGAGCHCAVSVCYCAISNGSKTDNIGLRQTRVPDHSADCIKAHELEEHVRDFEPPEVSVSVKEEL